MTTVKENLVAAKALIAEPGDWGKDEYQPRPGCYCALGALGAVLGMDPDDDMGPPEKALALALPTPSNNVSRVVDFNDDEHTTHADIMALFDRAIAAQEG